MKKINILKKLKKILAFALVLVMLTEVDNLQNLKYVFADLEGTYERLSGYSFDITVPVSISGDPDEIEKEIQVNVYFAQKDEENNYLCEERTMSIEGGTATIPNVPIYINEGTGNMQQGGTGEYKTDDNFYKISLKTNSINEGMYSVYFDTDGNDSAYVNLDKDSNDLIWSGTSKKTLVIKQRDVLEYSYNIEFYGKEPVAEFPTELSGSDLKLQYVENENTKEIIPEKPTSLSDSTFRVSYQKVPTSQEIDPTVKMSVVPTVTLSDGTTYVLYHADGTKYISGGEDNTNTISGSDVLGKNFSMKYIQDSTLTGAILWLDDGVDEYRKSLEDLKSCIKIYNAAGEDVSGNADVELVQNPDKANRIDLTVTGLPMFNPITGAAQNYYFRVIDSNPPEGEHTIRTGSSAPDTEHWYKVQYQNGENSASTSEAYDGATVYLSLSKTQSVQPIHIEWQDDSYNNHNNEARAEETTGVTLYLWRYTGSDPSNASPVTDARGSQYSYALTSDDFNISNNTSDITLRSFQAGDLPDYNENGRAYTYYVTAVDTKTGYSVQYATGDAGNRSVKTNGEQFARENETILLTRVGKGSLNVEVDWTKATSETDYAGTKTVLELQRRLKGSSDNWASIPCTLSGGGTSEKTTLTTTSASSSYTVIKDTFTDVDLYDEQGKSYEFRVIETALKTASNVETDLASGDSTWSANGEVETESITFRYKDHGYKATLEYLPAEESTGSFDATSITYKVNNVLYDTLPYTIHVRWDYSNTGTFKEKFKAELDAKLGATQLEGTKDYSAEPVEYVILRNGTEYATVSVKQIGENSEKKYQYTAVFEDGSSEQTGYVTVADSGSSFQWDFDALKLPKYDSDGKKYTYTVQNETNETGGEHLGNLKTALQTIADANGLDYSGFYLDRSYDANTGHVTIIHRLAVPGYSYHIVVNKKWNDNVTDYAKRQVEAHIVAMVKGEDDAYYLYEDLGKTKGENYKINLNSANEFVKDQYYTPISQEVCSGKNVKLYYTAVEYALSYDGYSKEIPWYTEVTTGLEKLKDENGNLIKDIDAETSDQKVYRVKNAALFVNAETITTPLYYEEGNPDNVKLYGYEISTTAGGLNYGFGGEDGAVRGHTKTFYNTIRQIYTDVAVQVDWTDDHNSAGYRQEKLAVKLYRSVNGRPAELVTKDALGNTLESKVWMTPTTQEDSGDITNHGDTYGSVDTIVFSNLPTYDENGTPYDYTVKQYLVNEAGTESEIEPSATESNTKNHYVMTSSKEVKSQVVLESEGERYCKKIEFSLHNYASNLKFSTQFYVLWRDEAAYQENARSDMKYTLYYTLGDADPKNPENMKKYDRSTFNSVVKAAGDSVEVGGIKVTQNPYYQKIVYTGLQQFVEGQRVHYYIKEEKAEAGGDVSFYDYVITYYDVENESTGDNAYSALEHKEQVKNLSGSLLGYYHWGFKPEKEPEGFSGQVTDNSTAGFCYAGEDQIIINSLQASIYVSGTKKWVNMSEEAEKPNCDIYLYRHSNYDETTKRTGEASLKEEPAQNTYVAKAKFAEDKRSYSFKDEADDRTKFPKYDLYGSLYTYQIGELITKKDNSVISTDIMKGTSDSNQVLVNTFNRTENVRSITINKKWEADGIVGGLYGAIAAGNEPVARFYVYRMESDQKVAEPGETENTVYADADQLTYKGTAEDEFVTGASNAPYSGNYRKYFSEKASLSDNTLELVKAVTIKYDSTATDSITLNDLSIYAPDGKAYVYFVVEDESYVPSYKVTNDAQTVLSEADTNDNGKGYALADNVIIVSNKDVGIGTKESGEAYANQSEVSFINTLKNETFMVLQGTIKWNEGSFSIGINERPLISDALDYIDLKVSRLAETQSGLSKDDQNTVTAVDVFKTNTLAENRGQGKFSESHSEDGKTYEWSFKDASDNLEYSVTWTDNGDDTWSYAIKIKGNFLKYAQNGNPYRYYVNESFNTAHVTGTNYGISSNNRSALASTASTVGDVETLTIAAIQNSLRGTYTVQKSWADGYDSYGLRPARVLVMFEYWDSTSDAWVPMTYKDDSTKVYTVELTKSGGWKNTMKTFPFEAKYDTPGMASPNYYKYRAVEIGIGFDQENNSTKWVATTDYVIDTYQTSGALTKQRDSWDFAASGTYQYNKDKQAENNIDEAYKCYSNGGFSSYKVLYKEDVINGYTFNASQQSRTTTVRNMLSDATTITVVKKWEDDGDAFAARPDKVSMLLLRRTREDKKEDGSTLNQPEYNNWEGIGEIQISKADALAGEPNTWQHTFENLPKYDENGFANEYRVIEYGTLPSKEKVAVMPDANATNVDAKTIYSDEADEEAITRLAGSIAGNYTVAGENSVNRLSYTLTGNQLNRTAEGYSIPYIGGYVMTGYQYETDGNSYFTTTITNKLISDQTLTVDKDWILKDDRGTADTSDDKAGDDAASAKSYTSKVHATLTYEYTKVDPGTNAESPATVEKTSIVTLSGSGYTYTWNSLPQYISVADSKTGYATLATVGDEENRKPAAVVQELAVNLRSDMAAEATVDGNGNLAVAYTTPGEQPEDPAQSIKNKGDRSVGTFTNGAQNWLVETSDGAYTAPAGDTPGETKYTITNTPLTSHTLEVSYIDDDAFHAVYKTRPTSAKIKLQYRLERENQWTNIEADSDFAKALLASVEYQNISVKADGTNGSGTSEDPYTYTISDLPAYIRVEDAENPATIKAYEYRILETEVDYAKASGAAADAALDVKYDTSDIYSTQNSFGGSTNPALSLVTLKNYPGTEGTGETGGYLKDRTVGGYTFTYTDADSDAALAGTRKTVLKKSLYTVSVQGNKKWDDQNDLYQTRPDKPNSKANGGTPQTESSEIQVTITKGTGADAKALPDVSITWSCETATPDTWTYQTPAVLPKYASASQNLEVYAVKETKSDSEYKVSYGENGSGATLANAVLDQTLNPVDGPVTNPPAGTGSTAVYQMSTITNTLKKQDLLVQKVWESATLCSKLGIEQKSVTFTVQVSTDGSNYTDLKKKDGEGTKPVTITLQYVADGETDPEGQNTVTDSQTEKRVTSATISDIPENYRGTNYTYRLLETREELAMTSASDSNIKTPVIYTLEADGVNYKVMEQVGTGGSAEKTSFASSALSGNSAYAYDFGIMKAAYTHTSADSSTPETYTYTNTTLTASVKTDISWKETLTTSPGTQNTQLQKMFRPDKVNYQLQRRIVNPASGSTDWEVLVSTADQSKNADNCITDSAAFTETGIAADAKVAQINDLPYYVLDSDEKVKTYEYRIVEETFLYAANAGSSTTPARAEGKRSLNYAIVQASGSAGTICSDFSGSSLILSCNDKQNPDSNIFAEGMENVFYTGTQTNAEENRVFTTTIVNTLQTANLAQQVQTQLTGKVTWLDNKDQLGKRPNGSGLSMTLRAQDASGNQILSAPFTLGDSASDGTEREINTTIKNTSGADLRAKLTWRKDNENGIWDYTITGLPLYNETGQYLTWSVCHTSDAADYQGKADNSEEGQKTDANQKYAFGKVTDVSNAYQNQADCKSIQQVDFVENLMTKVNLTKTWTDDDRYDSRPDALNLLLQYRVVSVNGEGKPVDESGNEIPENTPVEAGVGRSTWYTVPVDGLTKPSNWTEGQTSSDSWATINEGKVAAERELSASEQELTEAEIAANPYLKWEPTEAEKTQNTWNYELTLPQYQITSGPGVATNQYKLLQYRLVEIGKDKNDQYLLLDEESTEAASAGSGTLITAETPHIGSYYLTDYKVEWNNGYSNVTIENALDKRNDIVVVKVWNDEENHDSDSVTVKLTGMIHVNNDVDTEAAAYTQVLRKNEENPDQNWKQVYTDVPKYDKDFRLIDWNVTEVSAVIGGETLDFTDQNVLADNGLTGEQNATKLAGVSSDKNWIATYQKEESENATNSTITFTVTNTPTTQAKLTVNYEDDMENDYGTRFATTQAVLQYRFADKDGNNVEDTWKDVTDPAVASAFKETILKTVGTSRNAINSSYVNQYTYTFTELPRYMMVESGEGQVQKKVYYRVVETCQGLTESEQGWTAGQSTLAVNYENKTAGELSALKLTVVDDSGDAGDRASGGYTYTYSYTNPDSNPDTNPNALDQQADAVLNKVLLKTKLQGTKNWVDESDVSGCRPLITAVASVSGSDPAPVQQPSSELKIQVTEVESGLSHQPFIYWTDPDTSDNAWSFATTRIPKYNAQTNTQAVYSVTETFTNQQYETAYESITGEECPASSVVKSVTKVLDEPAGGGEEVPTGDTILTMADITNTLQMKEMCAKKVWRKDADVSEYDLVFVLQESTDSYEAIAGGGAVFTEAVLPSGSARKTLAANSGTDTVEWIGLPEQKPDGTPITYRILEETTRDNFTTEVQVSTEGNRTTGIFTNIQTQSFTITKTWHDTVENLHTAEDGSFLSEGSLQQQIGASADAQRMEDGSWSDVTGETFSLSSTYAETAAADNTKSKTFTSLPKYTVSGMPIYYSGLEKKVNGEDITLSPSQYYTTTYEHTDTTTKITNTLNDIRLVITKTDAEDGHSLQGVTFALYKEDGTEVTAGIPSGTTDAAGKLTLHVMEPGTYVIKETSGISGYVTGIEKTITLRDDQYNTDVPVSITNERKTGTLTLYKRDGESGESLDGVRFDLFRKEEGNIFQRIWNFITGRTYGYLESAYTDSTGTTKIENIPWGEYYIVETETLDGYAFASNQYYFKVNEVTVESPIELYYMESDGTVSDNNLPGNFIYNYKNKLTFQKQTLTENGSGATIRGGKYEIYKVNDAGGTENASAVKQSFKLSGAAGTPETDWFTIPEAPDEPASVSIYGLPKGNYVVREVEAPAGYAKAEDVPFTITIDGKILKAPDGAPWENGQVVMQDMPICSLTVTKEFTGDANLVHSIRPDTVKIQLYQSTNPAAGTGALSDADWKQPANAYGAPVEINNENDIDSDPSTYHHTFTGLPMYETQWNGTNKKVYYKAFEVDTEPLYTESESPVTEVSGSAAYAGYEYRETITNSISGVDYLYVTKKNSYAPASEALFNFYVEVGKDASHMHPYKEAYEVGIYNAGSHGFTGSGGETRQVSEGGYLTIKSEETMRLYIPVGATYRIREIFANEKEPEYEASYRLVNNTDGNDNTELPFTVVNDTSTNQNSRIKLFTAKYESGQKPHVTVTNSKKLYTAIDNETENHYNSEVPLEQVPTDAGGKVAVIEESSGGNGYTEEASDQSSVPYIEGKYGVLWKEEKDWKASDSFTITYTEFSSISGSADGSGQVVENPDGSTADTSHIQESQKKTITVTGYLDENGNLAKATVNPDGTLTNKTLPGTNELNPCYAELAERYPNFDIIQYNQDDGTKIIALYLANDITGLPYLNQIEVEFEPTIAVINTTVDRVGGQVKIEGGTYQPNSDGIGENQEDRYAGEKTVYVKADAGYCIELDTLEIARVGEIDIPSSGNEGQNENQDGTNNSNEPANDPAGDANDAGSAAMRSYIVDSLQSIWEPMQVYAEGSLVNGSRFATTLNYTMNGESHNYTLTGTVHVDATNPSGKPKEVRLVFDNLSMPVDVGIAFAADTYVPSSGSGSGSGHSHGSGSAGQTSGENNGQNSGLNGENPQPDTPGQDPGKVDGARTGDTSEKYLWLLLMLASASGIAGTLIGKKKKQNKHNK